jgi:hypothetical protein
MTLTDNTQSLSGAVEEYGPSKDDEAVVTLIQFDGMADPLSSDLFSPIAGWHDYESVSLRPPRMNITYHYADDNGDHYSTEEMLEGEPEWFDPPEEMPEWHE